MKLQHSILFLLFSAILFNLPAQVDQEKVDAFARNYAYANKVPLSEIESILNNATFQTSIIEKIQKPAEGTMTWTRYRSIFMTDDRINAGVEFWKENENTLRKVSAESGVPEEIILGIMGVETFFGQRKGTYKVLDALYTLAFGYPKRSKFFTSELEKFIELSREENLDINEVKGSYAGAIGYCQFMPSSYLAYAKSYDEGGTRDLVNSADDAIASVANYLKVHRWKNGKPIAVKARISENAQSLAKQSLKPKNDIAYYKNLGYQVNGNQNTEGLTTLVELETDTGKEHWFGFNNFYVITRYNHSALYAMAVFELSEALKERRSL